MRILILILFFASCSQLSKNKEENPLVPLHAALNHIHASYLKGCVDAGLRFEECKEMAKAHRDEVREIIKDEL